MFVLLWFGGGFVFFLRRLKGSAKQEIKSKQILQLHALPGHNERSGLGGAMADKREGRGEKCILLRDLFGYLCLNFQ